MMRNTFRTNTELLAFLRREGPQTTNEVARHYGWSLPYTYKELGALQDEGLIEGHIVHRRDFGGVVRSWEVVR